MKRNLNIQVAENLIKAIAPFVNIKKQENEGRFSNIMFSAFAKKANKDGAYPNAFIFFDTSKEVVNDDSIPNITIHYFDGENAKEIFLLSYEDVKKAKDVLVNLFA